MGLRPPWSQAAEQAEGEGLPSGGLGGGGGSPPPSHPLADVGQSLLLARSAGTYGAGSHEPRLDGLGCGVLSGGWAACLWRLEEEQWLGTVGQGF